MSARILWVGYQTIVRKEITRILRIWGQTIVPPAITMSLYFIIFGGLVGSRIGTMDGVPYTTFIAPGLIMMAVITNSFANVVSSFFSSKLMLHLEEMLVAPLSRATIVLGFVVGGIVRGMLVAALVTVVALFFTDLDVAHPMITLTAILLTALYLFNDVSDRTIDAYNPKKVPQDRQPLLERPGLFRNIALGVHGVTCVAAWALLGAWAAICTMSLLALNPFYSRIGKRVPGLDVALREGDSASIGAHKAEVWEVPGHTKGHIAYIFHNDHVAFVGDTLFAMGCGRLFEGSPQQMHRSLGRLAALAPEFRLYCAHEYTLANARFAAHAFPQNKDIADRLRQVEQERQANRPTVPTTVAQEQATNPFLLARDVELFAELRAEKDNFR